MRFIHLIALAFVSALFASPATALTCGGAMTVTLTLSTDVGTTCFAAGIGNGNNLGGGGDPIAALGYEILGTSSSSGDLSFSFSGTTGGTFSFVPDAEYEHYILGFQATAASPKPDHFAFALAELITSGSWSVAGAGNNVITGAFLYGQRVAEEITPVPLPAALVLFGSALAGFFGFSRLRERFRRPAVA